MLAVKVVVIYLLDTGPGRMRFDQARQTARKGAGARTTVPLLDPPAPVPSPPPPLPSPIAPPWPPSSPRAYRAVPAATHGQPSKPMPKNV